MAGNLNHPDSTPSRMRGPGVRRMNKWPIVGLCCAAIVITLLIILAGQQRKFDSPTETESHGFNNNSRAQELTAGGGYRLAATPPPSPTPRAIPSATPEDTELRARQAAFYSALQASSQVSDPLVDRMNQPPAVSKDIGQPVKRFIEPRHVAPLPFPSATPEATPRKWVADTKIEYPPTDYILQTGWVIRATLMTGMESQLRGAVIAQVTENVYDSPKGEYLLIPQGARLFGQYAGVVLFGQNRIAVDWERIIFPDGTSMDINESPGADAAGASGLHDLTDSHFLEIFSAALLLSIVNASIAITQQPSYYAHGGYNQGGYNQSGYSQEIGQAVGQQMGAAASNILQKFIDQPPTIKVRQGYKFIIIPLKDLPFPKPYVVGNFDKRDP